MAGRAAEWMDVNNVSFLEEKLQPLTICDSHHRFIWFFISRHFLAVAECYYLSSSPFILLLFIPSHYSIWSQGWWLLPSYNLLCSYTATLICSHFLSPSSSSISVSHTLQSHSHSHRFLSGEILKIDDSYSRASSLSLIPPLPSLHTPVAFPSSRRSEEGQPRLLWFNQSICLSGFPVQPALG